MPIISIIEKVTGGTQQDEYHMDLAAERVTVREMIKRSIEHQIAAKATSNTSQKINAKTELEKAFSSFAANQLIVLIDQKQASDLDEELVVSNKTRVTFLRLMPLVGG